MKYSNDILEIKKIIKLLFPSSHQDVEKSERVISKMATSIDDDYLMGRAQCLQSEIVNDESVYDGLTELYDDYCEESLCVTCPLKKYCNTYIKSSRDNIDRTSPVLVDLFCGAGGLSLGFTQEGFRTSLANDIETCCIDTYSHNHPETPRQYIVQGDISEIVENIQDMLRFKDVDVIVGGPPCQGFSMANRQRLIDDPRNYLYKNYVRAVDLIRPSFFVMENVKGMLSVADQVIEDFEEIGYSVSCRILNAKNYGVPQNRERLIYIGNRLGIDNTKLLDDIETTSKSLPHRVLRDALFGLRPLEASREKNNTESDSLKNGGKIQIANRQYNEYIDCINQGEECLLTFNHKARYNNDRDIEIFGRLEQGDKSDDPKIADIMPYARRNGIFKDKYYKLENDKVCKTITAHMKFDCNMYIHPTQARGLTPREAARVQSYPDDYYFRGAFTKTYMQIGNSVPPLLGRAIAKQIKRYLPERR